jgi:hypothetical protein
MISVDGWVLQRGVFWANELGTPLISEEEFWDIDGGYCNQFMPLTTAGTTITLVAEGSDSGSRGCFTRAFLNRIRELEVSQETAVFIYGDLTLTIRVPQNPLDVTPLRKMYGHGPNDIYYGTINLKRAI